MNVTAPPLNARVVAILRAACRVVVQEGAHGLRMASVAREAGVSKALVHYYFSTRQDLLRAAFAFSEERWHEAISDEIARLDTGLERLTRVLLALIDAEPVFSEHRALWNEVWSTLSFDDELRPMVERCYRDWLARIVELVEEGRADGSVPAPTIAEQAGWRLSAVADGLDSMLYLGLIDRERARELMLGSLQRELAA
jgi:AcrR family transcriptional regulator